MEKLLCEAKKELSSVVRPDAREWVNSKGETHRHSGPAIEAPAGYKAWYYNEQCIYDQYSMPSGICAMTKYSASTLDIIIDPSLFEFPGYSRAKR